MLLLVADVSAMCIPDVRKRLGQPLVSLLPWANQHFPTSTYMRSKTPSVLAYSAELLAYRNSWSVLGFVNMPDVFFALVLSSVLTFALRCCYFFQVISPVLSACALLQTCYFAE